MTVCSQPYVINTAQGNVIELPISAGISDYVNVNKTVWPTFLKLLKQSKTARTPTFFHFGCHQEGDPIYKQPFIEFFLKLSNLLHKKPQLNKQLVFQTVKQSGELAKLSINQ